jgi:hypothetical protein
MQAVETESTDSHRKNAKLKSHRRATYSKVLDQRKHPIPRLWVRNGRYCVQMTIEDLVTGVKQVKRVQLDGVSTAAQAVAK